MNLKKLSKIELETMSYTDIAYEIIKNSKKMMTTPKLFSEICHLLKLSDHEYEEKIGDFFTTLTVDKRFILIDSVNWDLKENHVVKIVIDDSDEVEGIEEFEDLDEMEDIEEVEVEEAPIEDDEYEESIETEDKIEEEMDDAEDLDELDEMEDLSVIEEEEEIEE